MGNIVSEVAEKAGGLKNLAKIHNVSYQAVWLWNQKGYFPLKQIPTVLKNFPDVTVNQLMANLENSE